MASVELRGILRSHPFRIFVPTAALAVLGSPVLVLYAFRVRDAMILQVGLSTAALFAVLLGLLAGSGSLARERGSGLVELVLSRPPGPGALVAGKWLGIGAAVGLSVAILGLVHAAALWHAGHPPPAGPFLAALLVAAVHGLLAAAAALLFSTFLRPGSAFAAALLFLLLGHAAALLPAGPLGEAARFLLPRVPHLNLAGEAAFGPFPPSLWLLAVAHGTLYALFLLTLAAPLAGRSRRG